MALPGGPDGMREVGIVPVLPGGPVEVVGRHFAPEAAAVLAERDAALERRLAGELEQALDAAGGLNLADQERRGSDGVTQGAVRRMVAGHVEIQPVAEGLVAVRGGVRPEVPGDAQGADPGRCPGRDRGLEESGIEGGVVGREGDGGIGERLKVGPDAVKGRRLAGDHGGGDVVDSGSFGRNGNFRIDQGVEEFAVAAALEVDADDGDFDNAVGRRVEAGGLDVDDESGNGRVCSHVHIMF